MKKALPIALVVVVLAALILVFSRPAEQPTAEPAPTAEPTAPVVETPEPEETPTMEPEKQDNEVAPMAARGVDEQDEEIGLFFKDGKWLTPINESALYETYFEMAYDIGTGSTIEAKINDEIEFLETTFDTMEVIPPENWKDLYREWRPTDDVEANTQQATNTTPSGTVNTNNQNNGGGSTTQPSGGGTTTQLSGGGSTTQSSGGGGTTTQSSGGGGSTAQPSGGGVDTPDELAAMGVGQGPGVEYEGLPSLEEMREQAKEHGYTLWCDMTPEQQEALYREAEELMNYGN